MDQKRILWITAAVGVFLLVVIGAALILYSPAQQKSASMTAEPVIASIQAQGDTWVRSSNIAPASSTTQVIPVTGTTPVVGSSELNNASALTVNNTTTAATVAANTVPATTTVPGTTVQNPVTDINGKDVTVISGTTNVYSSGTTTTIDLNALKNGGTAQIVSTAVPATTQTNVVKTSDPVATVAKTSTPKATTTTTAKTTTTKATTTTKSTTAKTADTAKTASSAKQYWVQAASFTSKKNAEDARSALTAAEISGEIFTYQDAKGALYYRVRVGPYTTSSEAEYWKARIVKLDMFINSQCYVTNTTIASIK